MTHFFIWTPPTQMSSISGSIFPLAMCLLKHLSISVVLHSPNHVSQSLVVFEEIIRVALVRVVIFLNTTPFTRLSVETHLYSTWFLLLL